jgi:hypothetical protein
MACINEILRVIFVLNITGYFPLNTITFHHCWNFKFIAFNEIKILFPMHTFCKTNTF